MYDILLVDDEEIFLQYMEQAIDWASFGCRICASLKDGKSALEYILSQRPDVVFMDISIPRINGLDVCEQMRAQGVDSRLIITTAHDEFTFAYKAIKLDIEDYLLKPFTADELAAALGKVVEKLGGAASEEPAPLPPEEPTAPARRSHGEDDALIQRIERYIAEHYTEADLTIDRVAEALQFENSYLRRVYKRSMGITIAQRIDLLRVQRAKELLADGSYVNREIAALIGYSDQYYFSKRFKHLCGDTPTAFRNKQKPANEPARE